MEISLGRQLRIFAVTAALTGAGCTGTSEDNSITTAQTKQISSAEIATTQPAQSTDIDVPKQQIDDQPTPGNSPPQCDSNESDPDGDGYGYEDGMSCLVIAPTSDISTNTNAINESAKIEQQSDNRADREQSTETQPEHLFESLTEQLPENRTEQNVPTCLSASSDPDGDGYGYENAATCMVEATVVQNQSAQVVSKLPGTIDTDQFPSNLHRVTDVILTAGQSNAFANGTRFEPDTYAEDRIDDRILVWTQNHGWKVANPLNQVWEHDLFPARPWDPGTSSNSPGFQIARAIVDADPNRVVAFIPTSTPGQSIHHWRYGAAPYNAIKQHVENALNDIPHKYQLDLIWWMQGESDANASDYYRRTLNELINNWRSEPWYGNNKYFIANETISFEINQLFRELRNNGDPYTNYSAAEGLPSIKPNGYHFSSQSYRIIGNRVQQVYRDMRRATGNE